MFSDLTENEKGIAERLMKLGLAKGALSLEMMVGSPVVMKSVEMGVPSVKGVNQYTNKEDHKLYLLKTELVGDLKGFCHLIFSEEDVLKIQTKCLPPDIMEANNSQSRLMKLEFMTEIDNMVAGSVVTQLANYLNLEVYGNVPILTTMKAEEANGHIDTESVDHSSTNILRTVYHVPELNIFTEFVWLFQDRFMDLISEFSKSEKSKEFASL
ncbi:MULTISPECIES: hypothetical protein [Reichenbachiella]|uniref:Chemotaxis protein CheC n=1 Tax=Reichenbachiella agariperforans TaxID=156994 RepID=A0A1M6KJK7_REIAG|nr:MULTISPECIES: hypothetical protein [Reichenbachiella]MBU2913583.1 hypothetical protein [Reichenbachiella agariperforans]RJE74461.1 hypothetical protein BGP76_14990 [Reichenbachiella sp. MSK19-1]SHJ59147.1 hypothetical protein SAMN04488028_101603 [Reichenbachiella agariperforans]